MQQTVRTKTISKVYPIPQMAPVRSIEQRKRIAVRTDGAIHLIRVDDIVRCVSDSNYCSIYFTNGLKLMISKTLKAVCDVLPATRFVRVHDSHLVRLDAISLVYTDHVVLYGGEEIPLARQRRKELMERLGEVVMYV